MIELEA